MGLSPTFMPRFVRRFSAAVASADIAAATDDGRRCALALVLLLLLPMLAKRAAAVAVVAVAVFLAFGALPADT